MNTEKPSDAINQFPESGYSDWARQMVESLVEAERKWLEMAAQQNEMVFQAIRQSLDYYQSAPTPTLAEWARQGIENLLDSQRKLTESVTQQRFDFFRGQIQEDTMGQDTPPMLNPTRGITDFAQQQVEMMADARRRWLDFAAQQNAQVVSGVKKGLGLDEGSTAATYADWAQQAVDNYVEVQKRWLDLATQLPFQRRK